MLVYRKSNHFYKMFKKHLIFIRLPFYTLMWALLNDHFDPIKLGFIISVQCLHTKVKGYTDLMTTCYFAYTSSNVWHVFTLVYILDCIWPCKLLPSLCCPCHLSSSLIFHVWIFIKNPKTIMEPKLTEFGN